MIFMANAMVPTLSPHSSVMAHISLNRTETQAITGTDLVESISIGPAKYYFKRPRLGMFNPLTGRYRVEGLAFTGSGQSKLEAKADWETTFHVRFQELYAKRPFEMSGEDAEEWQGLASMVDMYDYTNRTPITLKVIGCILGKRSHLHVLWLDGRESRFDYRDAPPDLAGLRLGRWFEAVAKIDPRTGNFQGLDAVCPTVKPKPPSAAAKFIESLPGTSELPDAEI
jgi:hypothetical protein